MKTEKDLQSYLRRQCKRHTISFDKVESKSRRGFPDCFLVYEGQVVLVELKTPAGTGRLSDSQKRVIADLTAHGVVVFIADSISSVDRIIQSIVGGDRAQ